MNRLLGPAVISAILFIFAPVRAEHFPLMEYDGAVTCAECHSGYVFDAQVVAEQFLTTVHGSFWTEITEAFGIYDRSETPVTGNYGKTNRYCGLPGTITHINWIGLVQVGNPNFPEGLPAGCARCHPSDASFLTKTIIPGNPAPEGYWETVDCMLCHAETYKVNGQEIVNAGTRRPIADASSPTGFRIQFPEGDDLSETSASMSAEVSVNACQRCHLYAGGGYMNKRGHDYMLDDVHANSLTCTDCHQVADHKFALGRPKPACWAMEIAEGGFNEEVSCSYCHLGGGGGPQPEHSAFAPSHFDNIACETCHAPFIKGLVEKRFDQIEQVLAGGLFKQWTFKETKIDPANPAIPDYYWYNGTIYSDVHPRGSNGDGKIYPWKTVNAWVPEDVTAGAMLPLKLGKVFGADSALSVYGGDSLACIDDAIRTGVKLAAQAWPSIYGNLVDSAGNYTAEYDWDWDEMVMAINHFIRPAEEALQCFDCHAVSGGRIDWTGLGFPGNPYPLGLEEIKTEGAPEEYRLNQNYPNPFNPATTIEFAVKESGKVMLSVFDIKGRLVETLHQGYLKAGVYNSYFNADDLASGIYFCRLQANNIELCEKMVLVK